MYNCEMNTLKLSGIFIFASFLITLISYFFKYDIFIFAGLFAWVALILLFKKIGNIKLLISLIFLSIIIFLLVHTIILLLIIKKQY